MTSTLHPAQTAFAIAKQAHLDLLARTITNAAQQGNLYAMFDTVDIFREHISTALTSQGYKYTVNDRVASCIRYSIDFSFSEEEKE